MFSSNADLLADMVRMIALLRTCGFDAILFKNYVSKQFEAYTHEYDVSIQISTMDFLTFGRADNVELTVTHGDSGLDISECQLILKI